MKIIIKLIYFFTDIIIPKKNIFVFTSKGGLCSEQNLIELFNYFQEKGKDCYLLRKPNSLSEIWLSLRARNVFITHGPGDIPYAIHSFRKNIIYLGHGITIKKMLFADHSVSSKRLLISGFESRFYTHIIASSISDQKNLSKVFRFNESKIKITGLPRIDQIKNSKKSLSDFFNKEGNYFLYAPTYRDYSPTKFFNLENFNIENLNNFLIHSNNYIIVRGHPNEKGLNSDIFNFSNILDGTMINNLYEYLDDFEGLITDYSSIYIDFLITDKKIAFSPYDLKEYSKHTGLFFNYEEITPGPYLKTQKDLFDFLNEDQKTNLVRREKVKKIFFQFDDAKSCERIYNLFH